MNPRNDWLGWSIHLERALLKPVRNPFESREMVREWIEFTGGSAVSLARRAFPLLNRRAARDSVVGDALGMIRDSGGPETYLKTVAAAKPRWVPFRHYPEAMKLSLEVVLFQEEERRALEGELRGLEFAWREAEAIASISDGLLPPDGWEEFRDRHFSSDDAVP